MSCFNKYKFKICKLSDQIDESCLIVKPYKIFILREVEDSFVSCNATNHSNFNHKTVHHWQKIVMELWPKYLTV